MTPTDPEPSQDVSPTSFPRPTAEELIGRALKLRCPRCGKGKLFTGFIRMQSHCPDCGFGFLRGPGYYLGSAYVNYGLTAVSMTAMFLAGRIFFNLNSRQMLLPLGLYCLILPLLIFRHSRALWLAFDCIFDSTALDDDQGQAPPAE